MESLVKLTRNIWVQRAFFVLGGAAAGYAYYAYVGCEGGCPLTGNPWSSAGYGALIGFILHPGRRGSASAAKPAPEQTNAQED